MPPMKLGHMKDQLVDMYESGMSITAISKEIDEYEQAIHTVLKKYVDLRPKKIHSVNEDYFENIDSEDKAYFLGFIAADGCLVDNSSGVLVLSISIHKKDRYILESFKHHIKAEHPISEIGNNQVRLTVTRKKIASDLQKLGIHERKSLTIEPMLHHIPESFKKDFIRGYFDGDGSIFSCTTSGTKLRYYVSFRGTESFLSEFKHFLGFGGSISFGNGTHQWRFGSLKDVNFFKNFIYHDSTIYLSRKKEKFPW